MKRCAWVNTNPLMIEYHDEVWGVPVHNDQELFAKLVLDGAQAGLSWETVLNKQNYYYLAFDQFDVQKVSEYDEEKVSELLQNSGIIRNRLKIRSAIRNAKAFLKVQEEFGSFDQYLWSFVNHVPIVNHFKNIHELPASTELSDRISSDLKSRGFNFVGSTIVYAFLQAVGVVNDHTLDCYKRN